MSVAYTRDEFTQEIAELYAHVYDLVYLRAHPLVEELVHDSSMARKEKGWRLHDLLLNAIQELDPGPQAPAYSREWRRHRLMVERYRNALEPTAVMQIIAVSRRQYYREHEAAIEAVAGILWEQYVARQAPGVEADSASFEAGHQEAHDADHLELLRLEAARLVQAGRYTDVLAVIDGVLAVLDEHLRHHGLAIRSMLPPALPGVSVEKGLLRQMLLGVLGFLAEHASDAAVSLEADYAEDSVHLALLVDSPDACQPVRPAELSERLAALDEMATLALITLETVRSGQTVVGFDLGLPRDAQHLVLVVDDNEDVLELVRRLLTPHGYRLATATNAEEALKLAVQLQPHVIILDLMLPGQDGWDLLQLLLNQPNTQHIPVVICSVLKQKELALSLGATAFLEKPVTERRLLEALRSLGAA